MTRHLSGYRWLRVEGNQRLAYRTGGSPEVDKSILLLHGMAGRSDTWDRFAGALGNEGWRVIAMDMRGHGRSSRSASYPLTAFGADVFRLLDELRIDRTDIVGHSLGAHVALRVAAEQPARVRRLVLEEPPVPPRDEANVATLRGAMPTASLSLASLLRIVFFNRFDWRMRRPTLATLRSPMPEWWDALRAIRAPSLLLSGSRSHVPLERQHALASAMPDAGVCQLEGSHRLHSEAPEAFLAAVLPFLLAGSPTRAIDPATTPLQSRHTIAAPDT